MTLKPRFWGCYFFKTHTGTAFYSEQLDFHLRVRTEPKIVVKFICVCQIILKPRFWGCCFFITHTGTAFDSEQLDLHLMLLACHKKSYLKKSRS